MAQMETLEAVQETKLFHLKKCPLFSCLTGTEMRQLNGSFEMVELGPNRIVPHHGEPCIYIVKKGYVRLNYTDSTGNEATVLLLGPGDVFGSTDPEDEEAFGEHCRTLKGTCLCRVSRAKFERFLEKYPDVAYTYRKLTFLRMKKLQVRLAEMMMLPAEPRLAKALLMLDQQIGVDAQPQGRKLSLALSHRELASLIGTSREFVTKLLATFRKRGLVDTSGKWIRLTDLDGLQSVAAQRA